MAFPRKALMDRVIVREIPISEYYRQEGGIVVDFDNANIRLRSDRGEVVAVGREVHPEDVKVGDVAFFDEFALCDPVFLNPADRNRPDMPRYWQIRVGDLKGVAADA